MKAIYLHPLSPFHLQTGSLDHESVESFPKADTVSAAITYLWFREYGELSGFPVSLPFRISSIMPAITINNTYVRCYPKPIGLSIDPDKIDHKVFKKIQYITEPIFEKWRSVNLEISDYPSTIKDERLWAGNTIWADREFRSDEFKLFEQETRTRVVLDRSTNKSVPFHFVSTLFGEKIRLFFLVDIEPDQEKKFMAMLRLLGDEGIGADRTVGMGQFEVENIEDIHFESMGNGQLINLGIFNPDKNETKAIDWMASRYTLFNRYGWTSGRRSLRRQTVSVIGEGAQLSCRESLKGTIRKVLDPIDPKLTKSGIELDHTIYRDCRGFFIPINKQ